MAQAISAEQQQNGAGGGRRIHGLALISVLAALLLTLLLEALDQTVVGTALPQIIGELQGFNDYTWVVTAYLLGSTAMIPIVGKLSDQFGRKSFLIGGVLIFLLGSALSGASQTIDQLIAFRALQGVGAGIGIALVFTVVGDIFPPAERAKWQGIFGGVYGFSSVVGPILGGWLTDHGPLLGSFVTAATRWRWIFYVNIPVGIAALVMLLVYLPANISVRTTAYHGWQAIRRIDFAGAALATAATIALLLGLTWGGNQVYDWNAPQVIGALIAAAALYAGFIAAERLAIEPVLPLDLFKNQVFASDAVLSLTQGMILLSLVIYLPLFVQGVLGQSATSSGAAITPLTLSMTAGATLAGFLVARLGRYQGIAIGGAVIAFAGVFLLTRLNPSTSLLTAGWNMVVAGLGVGTFFSILTLAIQNALPRSRMGVGTAATRYLQQLGGTLGLAIVGTVVNNSVAADIAQRLSPSIHAQLPPQALQFATNPQVLVNPAYRATVVRIAVSHAPTPQAIQQTQATLNQVFAALKLSLATGIQHGLVTVLAFCAVLFVASLFLKDVPLAMQFQAEPALSAADGQAA